MLFLRLIFFFIIVFFFKLQFVQCASLIPEYLINGYLVLDLQELCSFYKYMDVDFVMHSKELKDLMVIFNEKLQLYVKLGSDKEFLKSCSIEDIKSLDLAVRESAKNVMVAYNKLIINS